jgi:transcriptional regulator with XRE-family HTH domain
MAKIKIQEIMKLKDIKVRDLTESVPFSRATTYRILKGQKNPTIDDLEEFAKGLKVRGIRRGYHGLLKEEIIDTNLANDKHNKYNTNIRTKRAAYNYTYG